MQQEYFYKAFGLMFKSCIEHPEFLAEPATDTFDCSIVMGDVPFNLANPEKTGAVYQISGQQFLMRIRKVGRFLVENGRLITIAPDPAATPREIILFLWASAVAALLHQRGLFIMHGSAVKTGQKAILFSGPSGSGKSTFASAFSSDTGAFLICDDISAIDFNAAGIPVVKPGYPMMKLWRDSSEKFGIEWDETRLIRKNVDKMLVNTTDRFWNDDVPLKQIYLLAYKNEGNTTITEVTGYKKLELLVGKIFRKNYLPNESHNQAEIFAKASKILPFIRLCTVERQHGMTFFDKTVEEIRNDLEKETY